MINTDTEQRNLLASQSVIGDYPSTSNSLTDVQEK
jgi:hypothetical protein